MDVGLPRRPFSELKSLHQDSGNFSKQVEELGQKYSSWRDVRADGNCLYRCVARGLLEHFCRPFTDSCELEGLYKRIYYQEVRYIYHDEEIAESCMVLNVLLQLLDWKRSNEEGLMKALDKLLVNDAFMEPFIHLMRCMSHRAFFEYKPSNLYYDGIDEDPDMQKMLINGNLSGQYDYIGLGLAFDVDIQEIEMGRNNFQIELPQYIGQREKKDELWVRRLVLHVALIEGHHYIFYPKGLEELELVEEGRYRTLVEITNDSIREYDRVMRQERTGDQDED